MPFLTVGATTIDCDYGQEAKYSYERLAKKQRAMSGRLRVAQRAQKKRFVAQTIPISLATRSTIEGLGNAFQACSGDLTGSITCWFEVIDAKPANALATLWRLSLLLTEQ